jgi:hypothetical protein
MLHSLIQSLVFLHSLGLPYPQCHRSDECSLEVQSHDNLGPDYPIHFPTLPPRLQDDEPAPNTSQDTRGALQSGQRTRATMCVRRKCSRSPLGAYLLSRVRLHSHQTLRIRHNRMKPRRKQPMHQLRPSTTDHRQAKLISIRRKISASHQLTTSEHRSVKN